MKIYGQIDTRLQDVVSFDEPSSNVPYLLVVHPNDTDDWVKEELSARLEDHNCRGLLLVKGIPRAGLNNEEFAELKRHYGDRFHASACAVGTMDESSRLSGDLSKRFRDFFHDVNRAPDKIDWSILDPQWPATLISAYLLASVLATDTDEALLIKEEAGKWRPVWEEARKEHELMTGAALSQTELNRITAGSLATEIGDYLQTIAARVS